MDKKCVLSYGLWAKTNPYKSLINHMIDTGCMAEALLSNSSLGHLRSRIAQWLRCNEEQATIFTAYLSAVHDIGKAHPFFQGTYSDSKTVLQLMQEGKLQTGGHQEGFRHEKYSKAVLDRIWADKGLEKKQRRTLSKIIGLHHYEKPGYGGPPEGRIRAWWESTQNELEDQIYKVFPADIHLISRCIHMDALSMTLWGLIILSDWLASDTRFFGHIEAICLKEYITQARNRSKIAVCESGLCGISIFPDPVRFDIMWPEIPREGMRPVQTACEETIASENAGDIRLLMIEAPMGEGKTEAAVYAAAHMMHLNGTNGLYVALPTAATSNQMHERLSAMLTGHGIASVRLIHAMAWLVDEYTPDQSSDTEDRETVQRWLAPARRGMLSPYAVGTVDQVMLSVLTVRFGVLRLLGLAGKVLIIDEVHAYDAYMDTIIERLLAWCAALQVPVVLLSATLPVKKRRAFLEAYGYTSLNDRLEEAYPLITLGTSGGVVQQINVGGSHVRKELTLALLPLLGDWSTVAEMALGVVSEGGCLCVLVNTVGEAQKVYSLLREKATADVDLILFHARFPAKRRQTIEDKCIAYFGKGRPGLGKVTRPKRAILVASQVVEQSLDIDFDAMITAVAPIDLLLQRAGRVHRHEGRSRPETLSIPRLMVLRPGDSDNYGPTGAVYMPWILARTLDCLSQRRIIRIPEDIRQMVSSVYDTASPPADHPDFERWYETVYSQKFQQAQANACLLSWPDSDRFSYADRLDITSLDDNGDASDARTVRTRLGDDSRRVALLCEEDACALREIMIPSKEQARVVLEQTVSIRNQYIGDSAEGYGKPIECRGLLKGVTILPMKEGRTVMLTDRGRVTITLDDELGVKIEREG